MYCSRNHENVTSLEKAGETQLIGGTEEAEVRVNRQYCVFSVDNASIFPKILCLTDDGTLSKALFALLCVIPMFCVIYAHWKMLNCCYCRSSVLMYSCIATPTFYVKEQKKYRYEKLLQAN